METALDALGKGAVERDGPLPAGGPRAVEELIGATGELLPEEGAGGGVALGALGHALTAGAADPADPRCAAHLHAPPLAAAVAAEVVAATVNSSLDSWDQGPSGTVLEDRVLRELAELAGYRPDVAAGQVTSGGTESNLTALLLAREQAGNPGPGGATLFCSTEAHFSVQRAAGILGLGEDAVIPVPVDDRHRMDAAALRDRVTASLARGETPVAIVATAGTTDLGAIDPLDDVADVAAETGTWLHVDAAYGGGALFSRRLAPLLRGLPRADSAGLDLHKLGWQPVAAGVLLTRTAELFEPVERRVAYLNTDDDERAGYRSLLGRSLRTTRRPDVFKIAVTLKAYGRAGLGRMVDRCHDLAGHAARQVRERPELELMQHPVLSTVVFRFTPDRGDADEVNAALRRALLHDGKAVVGRTEFGAVYLKLTLLNPNADERDIDLLLDDVVAAGKRETPTR
nr:pyridoxal-dependent decarboxylase [Saccharopolyspora sp. HNM0983]